MAVANENSHAGQDDGRQPVPTLYMSFFSNKFVRGAAAVTMLGGLSMMCFGATLFVAGAFTPIGGTGALGIGVGGGLVQAVGLIASALGSVPTAGGGLMFFACERARQASEEKGVALQPRPL